MKSLHDIAGTHPIQLMHDDVAAGTAATKSVCYVPFDAKLTAVLFIPMAAITANDTNYFTLTLTDDDGDTIGEAKAFNTSYDDMAAEEILVLDGDDTDVDAGDIISLGITHAASGLAVPDFMTVALIVAR